MAEQDASDTGGGFQGLQRPGTEVFRRALAEPGCADHFHIDQPRHRNRLVVFNHDDVTPGLVAKGLAAEDRGGVQRVVVTGQQEHRHRHAVQRVQRPAQGLGRELVGFEHVPRYYHELCMVPLGQFSERTNRINACLTVARRRLLAEEGAGHADLPVGCMDEFHVLLCPPMSRVWGKHYPLPTHAVIDFDVHHSTDAAAGSP